MHYHLKNLEVETSIGVYESEKTATQKIIVSVEFDFDSSDAAKSDDLADTVDYSQLEQLIRAVCEAKHYQLLEKLQAVLKQKIEADFTDIQNVKVSIEKFPFKNGSILIT